MLQMVLGLTSFHSFTLSNWTGFSLEFIKLYSESTGTSSVARQKIRQSLIGK